MDTSVAYQTMIKRILTEYAEYRSRGSATILSETVFDDEHGHYLVLDLGWDGKNYWHSAPIHLDVIDHKIWVQYDDTEEGIATDLLEAGVPKDDIVLGFRHPKIRKYTGFADISTPLLHDERQQPSAIAV